MYKFATQCELYPVFSKVSFRFVLPSTVRSTVLFRTVGLQSVCCPAACGVPKYLMRTARTTEVLLLFEIVYHFLTEIM